MFRAEEIYRYNGNPLMQSSEADGPNGVFRIPLSNSSCAWCIMSDGLGWEHVSVYITKGLESADDQRTPTWAEMCKIKDIFWDSDECVIQYHPSW